MQNSIERGRTEQIQRECYADGNSPTEAQDCINRYSEDYRLDKELWKFPNIYWRARSVILVWIIFLPIDLYVLCRGLAIYFVWAHPYINLTALRFDGGEPYKRYPPLGSRLLHSFRASSSCSLYGSSVPLTRILHNCRAYLPTVINASSDIARNRSRSLRRCISPDSKPTAIAVSLVVEETGLRIYQIVARNGCEPSASKNRDAKTNREVDSLPVRR